MSKALTIGVTIHVDRDTHIDHLGLVTDGPGGFPFIVTHIGEGLACASIFYDDWQHLADVANDMLNAARVHLEPENVPCKGCGGTVLPLHTDGMCPNCHELDAEVDEHGSEWNPITGWDVT